MGTGATHPGGRFRLGAKIAVGALVALLVPVATPAHAAPQPHVWLHYDYVVYPDGHTAAPLPSAIDLVVEAYADHGVLLEIDPEHTPIPKSDPVVAFDVDGGGDCGDSLPFSRYFPNRSRHSSHYVAFSDEVTSTFSDCQTGFSGIAEQSGNDFVIAVARLRSDLELAERRSTAGTFMHELGHNLGLRHGGNEDQNWKPNYLSVMNYAFQVTGILSATGHRIDYSDSALPTMDLQHLDEIHGLGVDSTDRTKFPIDGGEFGSGSGPISGPIDWDWDGDHGTEPDVAVTWYDQTDATPMPRFLTGFDDWSAVRAYLGSAIPRHTPKVVAE